MSSSKGIGSSAYEVSKILPPSLLRFLMIRYLPNAVIDFDLYNNTIPLLFDEYDRCAKSFYSSKKNKNKEKESSHLLYSRSFFLSEVDSDFFNEHMCIKFLTLSVLVQIKGLDIYKYLENQKGSALTHIDKKQIELRLKYVRKWLDRFAPEDSKFEILSDISEDIKDGIIGWKKEFLQKLFDKINQINKDNVSSEEIHNSIYTVIKENDFNIKESFEILYLILSSKRKGPKLGKLFYNLGLEFIQKRIQVFLE